MIHFKLLIIIPLMSFLSCGGDNNDDLIAPQTLKGTSWTSQFHHYCNFYRFETDSTGFIENGQVAWSCPVDTLALVVSGNDILYDDPKKFIYKISDSILIIENLVNESRDEANRNIFYYRPEENRWVSEHEYVYGKEYLESGEKKEKFRE